MQAVALNKSTNNTSGRANVNDADLKALVLYVDGKPIVIGLTILCNVSTGTQAGYNAEVTLFNTNDTSSVLANAAATYLLRKYPLDTITGSSFYNSCPICANNDIYGQGYVYVRQDVGPTGPVGYGRLVVGVEGFKTSSMSTKLMFNI